MRTRPRSLSWEEREVIPSASGAVHPLLLPREGGRGMSSARPQVSLNAKRDLVLVAKKTCRELRRRSTPTEEIFWSAVRDRRFLGRKFYRQHPIFVDHMGRESFYVADFYCHQEKLVVEIDGKIHELQVERDNLRTAMINECGVKVVRFKNEEIEKSLSEVMRRLKELIEGT